MVPKQRKTFKHLPPCVHFKHGAYYYVDANRKWHRLGKQLAEAMAKWARMVNKQSKIVSMNDLFDRYIKEIAPLKSPKTFRDNSYQLVPLRLFFGKMYPEDITPVMVYEYIDMRSKKTPVAANREVSLLSHSFSYAIRWGIVGANPCKDVKRITEKPRDRYINDIEYQAVHNIAPKLIQCAMDFAYLTGQRLGDILKIKFSDLSQDGIFIKQNKTAVKILIRWTDELKKCVDNIKSIERSVKSMTLFCNGQGQAYTVQGFSSMWQRVMNNAIERKLIEKRFQFRDIRAKTRSDSEDGQKASALLGHTNIAITDRVYNRKYKKVDPLK